MAHLPARLGAPRGHIRYHGTMAELAANDAVRRDYLAV